MNEKKTHPFNNSVDTGLRMLCLLNFAHPKSIDLQKLIYLDYLMVHSGDIDNNIASLHPPVPYRTGEIFIRRKITQRGLQLFLSKNLINVQYTKEGIEYRAEESSTPFLEILEEGYFLNLIERAKWVTERFLEVSPEELKSLIQSSAKNINEDFKLEILQ